MSDIIFVSQKTSVVSVAETGARIIVEHPKVVALNNLRGPQGAAWQETFESVSKNLKSFPYQINRTFGVISLIVYDLGNGKSITKTLSYTSGNLTSIVLSGDTPHGIALTKTLEYTDGNLTSIGYG